MVKPIAAVLVGLSVISCDVTSYVGVRNHAGPCVIEVGFERPEPYQWFRDSDTLYLRDTAGSAPDDLVLRENLDGVRYRFTLPPGRIVALQPVGLNSCPIRTITFHGPDSTWTLPSDRKAFKALIRRGVVHRVGPLGRGGLEVDLH